jgi:hypothetical protein
MHRNVLLSCLALLVLWASPMAYAAERAPTRLSTEVLIAPADSSWMLETLTISPDGERIASVAYKEDRQFVVVDGKPGKQYQSIGQGTLLFSPDGRRAAYTARENGRWFAVVDGKEGKKYDGTGMPVFSPNSAAVLMWQKLTTSGSWSLTEKRGRNTTVSPMDPSSSARTASILFMW